MTPPYRTYRLRWSEIRILYLKEMKSAFRERTVVFNTVLLPVFLYPVMLWAMFTALTFVQGRNEGFTSRVAILTPVPEEHGELADSLRAGLGLRWWTGEFDRRGGAVLDSVPARLPVVGGAEVERLLAEEEIDAVIALRAAEGEAAALPGNFAVSIRFDQAVDRSRRAATRLETAVEDYRERWVARAGADLGLPESERMRFTLDRRDVSSSEDVGAFLLGQMISLFLVIMIALGCFVPAVDTTAGERERSTWETLMTVAASRTSIVVAKYLHVATLGVIAGSLNVIALFISIGAVIRPLLESAGASEGAITFQLPLAALPIMVVGAVMLALFFAAAMMILASFARSFKDGQAMVQPVYWLVFIPLLLGQQTDATLTPAIASVPVANVAMMIRDAANGVFLWPLIAQTLAVTAATIVLCLLAARTILRVEDFLLGSFDGSFWRFLKDRIIRSSSRPTS